MSPARTLTSSRTLPEADDALDELLRGLTDSRKSIPCKYFYDEKGAGLFERICAQPEYYLTRTETIILRDNIRDICAKIGKGCVLAELGSGAGEKVRLLMDHLPSLAAYVPIDISAEQLGEVSRALHKAYPRIPVLPINADYTRPFRLPGFTFPHSRIVVFYPGSTICNFTPDEARAFLKTLAGLCGPGGGLLLGVDLKKSKSELDAAYNDRAGVTAAFNLNILEHVNRISDAEFRPDLFRHHAFYNDKEGRIEMSLVSLERQIVPVAGVRIELDEGESILTEYSYKYSIEEFRGLAAGIFETEQVWTDKAQRFSVQYLARP